MNWIETLIVIFMLAVILLNAIASPRLSYEYAKASLSNGKKIVVFIVKVVGKAIDMFRDGTHESIPVQSSWHGPVFS